jgi:hypothetical protein
MTTQPARADGTPVLVVGWLLVAIGWALLVAGYDAERTLMAFRERVRGETDVEAVTTDVAATTRSVVVPASISLWLRPRRAGR